MLWLSLLLDLSITDHKELREFKGIKVTQDETVLKRINQHTWNNKLKMMYRYGTSNPTTALYQVQIQPWTCFKQTTED